MSTLTDRWSRDAVLARLAASKAVDADTIYTPRERAQRRLDIVRVTSALDEGKLDAASAEAEFRHIASMLLPLSA